MRLAVLGSGLFGIAAVRALVPVSGSSGPGLDVVWISEDREPGGLWNGSSAVDRTYRSLHMITPHADSVLESDREAVRDPDRFLHHREYADYLARAARQAPVCREFGTRVLAVRATGDLARTSQPRQDGRPSRGDWTLTLENDRGRSEMRVDLVVNATGRHTRPVFSPEPHPQARYSSWHVAEHGRMSPVRDARCLVIGLGPSGADVASDLAAQGNQVDLSIRSPAWVVPKYVLGKPARIDRGGRVQQRMLKPVRRRLAAPILRHLVGDQTAWGLPRPPGGPLDGTPVPSDLLIHALRHRLVVPRPAVAELLETGARFADGSTSDYDVVVWATGYDWSAAHLPEMLVSSVRRRGLELGLFPLGWPGIALLNGFRCQGAAMACAQTQADLVRAWVAGRLPGPEQGRPSGSILDPAGCRRGMTGPDYARFVQDGLGAASRPRGRR